MIKIDEALGVLEKNIGTIRNVSEWAYELGYKKPSKFSWEFRERHRVRPSKVFIEMKVEKVVEYMVKNPNEKNYCVCLEFGFTNEKALYKFLKRHTNQSPTQLREKG